MKYLYALFVFLLALFLAAFIQQNGQGIELRYFSWSTPSLPLSLYMILAFAAGYVLAVIVGFSGGIRSRLRTSSAERALKKVRSELEDLKKEAGLAKSGAVSRESSPGEGGGTSPEDAAVPDPPVEEIDPDDKTAVLGPGGAEEK